MILSSPGVFAFSVAGSVSLPVLSFAFAVTSVPFATLSAGIVTFPVVGSTVKPSGASAGSVQFPSSSFVTVTVFGSVDPSGVYVTSTDFVSASVGGVTSTLPSSFAVTLGFPGAVVSSFGTTVTVASTVSVEPSLYLTTTGIFISLPASASGTYSN